MRTGGLGTALVTATALACSVMAFSSTEGAAPEGLPPLKPTYLTRTADTYHTVASTPVPLPVGHPTVLPYVLKVPGPETRAAGVARVTIPLLGDVADSPEPIAGGSSPPPNPLASLRLPRELGSSRYEAEVSLSQGGASLGSLIVLVEYSAEQDAQRLQVRFVAGDGQETVRLDEIRVGRRIYSYTGDPQNPWTVTISDSEEDVALALGDLAWLVHPALVMNAEAPEWSRSERLGGDPVKHYRFGPGSVSPEWLEQLDLPSIRVTSIDAWVSVELEALAALVVEAVYDGPSGPAMLSAQAHLRDVGANVSIHEPQMCARLDLPEDVPLPDGAIHLSEECGTWVYETTISPDTLANLYTRLLQERGWRMASEESFAPDYILFERADHRLSLRAVSTADGTFVILALSPRY